MGSSQDGARRPAGNEELILCLPDDRFTGVTAEWLIPRLRLDPDVSHLEGGFEIYLDGEDFFFPDMTTDELGACVFGRTENDGDLVTVGIGEYFAMHSNIWGGWVESIDVDDSTTDFSYVSEEADLKEIALLEVAGMLNISDAIDLEEDNDFSVRSPFLSADDPQVVAELMRLAPRASSITINGTRVE